MTEHYEQPQMVTTTGGEFEERLRRLSEEVFRRYPQITYVQSDHTRFSRIDFWEA